MSLTPEQITRVCRLADRLSGIQWDASKAYLIESRLVARLEELKCQDLDEMVAKIEAGDNRLRNTFIDLVTTRETHFFRDDSPFLAFEHKAIPEIIDAKAGTPHAKRLRIWSAACSSGQEPYSIAITLSEMLPNPADWDIQILATDLSDAALGTASRGFYSDFEIGRGMRPEFLDRYFVREQGGWQVCDEIRAMVSFSRRNLLEPFTGLGPFDVIFCRNVAIYFDLPVKRELFERLASVTASDGCIFVGASENLSDYGPRWAPQLHCRTTFYQPNRLRTAFSLQPVHKLAHEPVLR
jgi:chemotaxis protein methyltransferase CheR